MARIIKGHFYINPGYINSTKKEEFEIEFEDDDPENIVEAVLEDNFNDFLGNTDMGWVIENDEII